MCLVGWGFVRYVGSCASIDENQFDLCESWKHLDSDATCCFVFFVMKFKVAAEVFSTRLCTALLPCCLYLVLLGARVGPEDVGVRWDYSPRVTIKT